MQEIHGTASGRVTATPEVVFMVITDVERLPEWNRAIERVVEPAPELAAGTEWVVKMHPSRGMTWRSRSRVEEIDRDAGRFTYRTWNANGNPSYADWKWEVVPLDSIAHDTNTYLMMRFNSEMHHRGWADYTSGLRYFRAHDAAMARLRAAITSMFSLASSLDDPREFAMLNRPIQETLLACLDDTLVPAESHRARAGSFDKHRKLIAQLDEIAATFGSRPLYSEDLAAALNISVRTLQTATHAVHGVSLHHYLRLKRLWSTRMQLMSGFSGLSVKAAALGNGFWHLGDFSRGYRVAFGEMPSETLARSRRL